MWVAAGVFELTYFLKHAVFPKPDLFHHTSQLTLKVLMMCSVLGKLTQEGLSEIQCLAQNG